MGSIRLIVNGDDFGISHEVNEAILRAFREGVLTSCSLMVTGDAFEHAVEMAKENPGLAVGIHLVTVMGRSVLPKTEIPNLVDECRNFSNNPNAAGLKYYFSAQARKELRKELAAQFEKFHSTGIRLSHIDGHLHLHVHPVIFKTAMKLGEQYGTRKMRVPVEELRVALGFDRRHMVRKALYAGLFGLLGRYMKRELKLHGFTLSERVYGNLLSGEISEAYFLYMLDRLGAGVNEIYFHPAFYADASSLSREQAQGLAEFRALTSRDVRERIQQHGIRLINYFELDTIQ